MMIVTALIVLAVLILLRPIVFGLIFVGLFVLTLIGLGIAWGGAALVYDGAAWFIRTAHPEDWIALAVLLVCWIGGAIAWSEWETRKR